MSQKFVIIVAGGTGSRMQSQLPKQFIEINQKPILVHTLEAFLEAWTDIQIVVVMNPNYLDFWAEMCGRYVWKNKVKTVAGGNTRFHSVKNGLSAIVGDTGIVGVHDAVRPFVNTAFLQKLYAVAEQKKAVIPVITLKDSIRILEEDGVSKAVDRAKYRLVQTPQCFELKILRKAYTQKYQTHFTDDASVVENMGVFVKLTEGVDNNIKITTPADLKWAKSFLS